MHKNSQYQLNSTGITISVNIADSTVQESDGTATVQVVLSGPSSDDISVNLRLIGGSANGTTFIEHLWLAINEIILPL